MRHCLIILLLVVTGCLETPPDSTVDAPTFDDLGTLTDPVVDVAVITRKVIPDDPFPQLPQAPEPKGYTGAVVHVSNDCAPCHWLLIDLEWLRDTHGWTLAETGQEAHWLIDRQQTQAKYPTIQYFRDGQLIGTVTGYSVARDFSERKDRLRDLVRGHPDRRPEL